MDAVFSLLNPSDRTTYLRSLLHSFGCSYICLWFYSPQPTDHLSCLDGYYNEDNTTPGSSAGSFAQRLFNEYRREMFFLVNDRVPGMAFINNQPYRQLNEFDVQQMASISVQRQFYQEANIKTAVFLGCRSGEIEMGWSNGSAHQVNMENSIRKWFSDDMISRQQSPLTEFNPQPVDPSRVSPTSSSSLRSLSMDSPDSPSALLFNLPSSTAHIPEVVVSLEPAAAAASLHPIPATSIHPMLQYLHQIDQTTTAPLIHHQSPSPMQAFALPRSTHLPSPESEQEAMTQAILAVLTSSSPSSFTASSTPHLPHPHLPQLNRKPSAFKRYLVPTTPARQNLRRQTMLKRSITYYRNLNIARREHIVSSRPTSTQLHHMISERKRREKINESFEALRKLLPPEAKKDKASVLSRTREHLSSLRDQVEELRKRNNQLEAQLLMPSEDSGEPSSERVVVRITHVTESTSEEQRIVNLQVVLRGESSVSDMVIRILEFLRQDQNVNLMSMEASTILDQSRSSNRVILRLRIEGNEWDEAGFQEAVKRVVADLL